MKKLNSSVYFPEAHSDFSNSNILLCGLCNETETNERLLSSRMWKKRMEKQTTLTHSHTK